MSFSLHKNPKGQRSESFGLVAVGIRGSGVWGRHGSSEPPPHTCPVHLSHLPVSELQPSIIDPEFGNQNASPGPVSWLLSKPRRGPLERRICGQWVRGAGDRHLKQGQPCRTEPSTFGLRCCHPADRVGMELDRRTPSRWWRTAGCCAETPHTPRNWCQNP